MMKIFNATVLIGATWMALTAFGAAETLEAVTEDWRQRLVQLGGGQGVDTSFCLQDTAGNVIVQWNSQRLMLPASTLKVATAVAILEQGELDKPLRTRIQIQGKRIRWQGGYDPELTSGQLEDLMLQIVPKLEGSVVLEVPGPEPEPYPSGWSWDDLSSSFAPPVAELVFDRGLIPLRILRTTGQQLQVAGPPWTPQDGLGFLARPAGATYDFDMRVMPGWPGWVMVGEVAPGVEEAVTVPMLRPELAAARLLGEVLRRRGLKVEVGAWSPDFRADWEVSHDSRPVRQVLAQALADSDNLAMECLYRRFGRKSPKVWKDLAPVRVADGSGLSRYNSVSSGHLMAALQSQPEVVDLLPASGEGTLKRRFLDSPLQGKIRAKTGTLSGASGLMGEFIAASGGSFRFVLLTQGFIGSSQPFKQAESDLVLALAKIL